MKMSANKSKAERTVAKGGGEQMELDARKMRILQAIIDDYILTASPVGSRTIAKSTDIGLSSATIRNEMSDLAMHPWCFHRGCIGKAEVHTLGRPWRREGAAAYRYRFRSYAGFTDTDPLRNGAE